MPIKYNLTKYDMLAEEFHELSQKKDGLFTKDEETLKAEAIIIASFASAHSWQTYKIVSDGNPNLILTSPEVKDEHTLAKNDRWKRIKPPEIQDVARMNIKDSIFYVWLSVNVTNGSRDVYKTAWSKLKEDFNEECDGISIPQR
jgi:hypothetical protein